MNNAHTILFVLANLFSVMANAQKTVYIRVEIQNVKNRKGDILVALYNSDKTFLKTKFKVEKVSASSSEAFVQFNNLANGEYAIAIIHDENSDGKFNSNLLGMPSEGFGFSNNAKGFFGPPSFEKARFTVISNVTQKITLRYF